MLKVISLLLLAVHHKAILESARLALGILATANSDLSAVFPNGRSIRWEKARQRKRNYEALKCQTG